MVSRAKREVVTWQRTCGLICVACAVLISWSPAAAQAPPGDRGELAAAIEELAARQDADHIVVQFEQPMSRATRQALEDRGLILQGYLGNNSFYALLDREVLDAAGITQVSTIAEARPIEREMKLQPMLARLEIPDFAIVSPRKEGIEDPNPVIAVYVGFHRDVALRPDAAGIVRSHGGWIRSFVEAAGFLVVEMPLLEVGPLADEDAVRSISLPLPKFSEVNNSNREITQANIVQAAPYNLDGGGVTVLVYDGGQVYAHQDFENRLTVGPTDTSGISDHSTHVAGTVGGAGIGNSLYKGMAPGVEIISYGYEQEGGLQQGFLYTDPGDIEADYGAAINTYGAHISNNSIGTNTAPNGFPCEWEGDYGDTGQLIDTIVRGGIHASFANPFRIVWANGNERQTTRCFTPGLDQYHTTAPPACAKNHITVGAMNSNDDSVTSFTSWGPTDDGRLKPDVSGPGCQSNDDFGVTSCSSSGGYNSKCGTSMASPTVCGLSSLLLQDYRAQFPTEPDPRNSTVKALLAHNAVDIENTGPDYKTGYGSVRIADTIDFMRTENFIEGEIADTADSVSMLVYVEAGDPEFKATLAWDDMPGPLVYGTGNPVLVNDLDLRVYDPLGQRRYPWTLDPANPWDPAVQTGEDHANNIEQVYVANPDPGVWLVEIYGYNVPDTTIGPQPFSLAASPLLIKCSSAGVVKLDSELYACESVAEIKVVDCDLNTDDQVVETATATIASDSEPTPESVLLTETGTATADFRGTIPLSATDAAGVLLVAHADTVTATYVDADDGQGGTNVTVTDAAGVDCVPPVISNVQTTDIEARRATVTFNTDEDAVGTVRYGLACGALTETAGGAAFATAHAIALTGLQENTTYFYAVDAEDRAGNGATDDNGGACYTFTTPDIPDYFTEQFSGDNDLDYLSLRFVPDGSYDYYAGCADSIASLPVDPIGGTTISSWTPSSDDGYALISLTGGATVSLYGVSYSSFYVGTNGYITFGSGYSGYTETLANHFLLPRISALFDDLNPGVGGAVSWKQLADRAVVTWENVPEYGTLTDNTFQVEMHFDGTLVISYLNITATDGIAGLSEGNGEPADFYESDLSAMASCSEPTCDDGIQNQGEDRIDCGGPCPPCDCLSDATCDDGLFCSGAETCDAYGHCQPGGDPCPGQFCDEDNDQCVDCLDDGDCDDGQFCNGAETCVAGACQLGVDPCPGMGCDEINDVCVVCDNNGVCEPGEDCNTCPNDCFTGEGAACGNGVCETANGEDCVSCPADCNSKLGGKPNGRFCCGDGTAQYGVTCADSRCHEDGYMCSYDPAVPSCCGDGICEGSEDSYNCEVDCGPPPICGNFICDEDEDQCNCPADCGTPPLTETDCADGVDNDCDDLVDGADPDCACLAKGEPCVTDDECCSNWCHRGACK